MPQIPEQLALVAAHFTHRRQAVMAAWRRRVSSDPALKTGATLPRTQLHDHIPALLHDFERRLTVSDPGPRAAAESAQEGDAAAHGLHRWQQGFDLSEVARELGRLNECVVAELDQCAAALPVAPATMAEARKAWAALYSVAVSASTSQYFKLQQIEALGQLSDVEQAMESLRDLERQRAALWQQAAHDLRGNLDVVAMATAGLASPLASDATRLQFMGALDRNVRALHALLEDVTSLARLQGGQEQARLAPIDASHLLRGLGEALEPMAAERKLSLGFDGPATLPVQGDALKTRRIVQNLVINAIKYTRHGGVSVLWGQEPNDGPDRWFIEVKDTGPGFHAGPGSALAGALGVATEQAKGVAAGAEAGTITHTRPQLPTDDADRGDTRAVHQQPGEGIGLSIVKRLCGLLDATMELHSTIGVGTTVRILLPARYGAPDGGSAPESRSRSAEE